jgi:hypothetical protein
MNFNTVFDYLKVITISSSVIELFLFIGFVIVNYLFRKSIDAQFEKSLEKFKVEMQKYMDLTFRDEEARTSIISNTVICADAKRLELYQDVYKMFFRIMYSHDIIISERDRTKQEEMIIKLHNDINNIRTELFVNSVYLGKLIDYLIPAQVGLWNDLGIIQAKINGIWSGLQPKDFQSSEEIRNAERWIQENMKPYLTLNHIDFSEDIINKLHDKRVEIIQDQLK